MTPLRFRILGPLDALRDGEPVALPGGKALAVLALLLLHRGEVVSTERLIDELWGESPPDTAAGAVQVHVSNLRKALAPGKQIFTRGAGYGIELEPGALDLDAFEQLVARAREAQPQQAAELLRDALALWRGPALAGVALEHGAQAEAHRLDELRLAALEDRIEAELALGRHAEVVAELEALVAQHPLRERLRAHLLVALYRAGRQAEALEAYRLARAHLVEQLGIEPGPQLQRLERAILEQDPSLDAPVHASSVRLSLPAAATPLVGREAELEHAQALLLGQARLLTLSGAGGVGKTRLALELAHRLAPEFPDGAAYVALGAVEDPALVRPVLAQGLDVASLATDLRDRTLLVVIDNFEHVVEAAPVLAELLAAAPSVKLLVTSRAVLHIAGEHELVVAPLPVPQAIELFVQRASAAGLESALTAEVAGAVAELCVRLEGLPLAIELAAARSKLLPPTAMLARLGRRLDLPGGTARDAPARQQTLRTTIDWSHGLLSEEEQRLFARLAVFAGGCTLDAVEAVCGDAVGVIEPLASLVDKSLVTRAPGATARFAMLETVREYALERLVLDPGERGVRRRHAEHFTALAEEAEPLLRGGEQQLWFERLELEHDNVRAAFAFALDADPSLALRLAAALRLFWQVHGHLGEGRRALETALERVPAEASLVRSKALNGAGILAGEQGDYAAARARFEEALAIARQLENPERVAAALSNVGNIDLFERRYEAASHKFVEARDIWDALGSPRGAAVTRQNLACVERVQGRLENARALLVEAIALAREAADRQELASCMRDLCHTLLAAGRDDEVVPLVAETLEIVRDIGEPHAAADWLETTAGLVTAQGDPATAAMLLGAADAQRESIRARRLGDLQDWYESSAAAIRAALGEEAFDEGVVRGRALSLDDAISLGSDAVAARAPAAAS